MLEKITFTSSGFFRSGVPFFPVISPRPRLEEIRLVPVDLTPSSLLHPPLFEKTNHLLFLELDFGFTSFDGWDGGEVKKKARVFGAQWLINRVLPKVLPRIFGISIYQGTLERKNVAAIADWIESVSPLFPEEIPLFAQFIVEENMSSMELSSLVSPSYFPCIQVGLTSHRAPIGILRKEGERWIGVHHPKATIGVVVPSSSKFTKEEVLRMERLLSSLDEKGEAYRIVNESHLSEQWDELESLILSSPILSSQGARKIQGFLAAGGQVLDF